MNDFQIIRSAFTNLNVNFSEFKTTKSIINIGKLPAETKCSMWVNGVCFLFDKNYNFIGTLNVGKSHIENRFK